MIGIERGRIRGGETMQQVVIEVKTSELQDAERPRKAKFDIIDLYEEMLGRRAELGFRPVLYMASELDLECNLIGLYEQESAEEATGEAIPTARSMEELRRRLR
jgi:hypothetical protein